MNPFSLLTGVWGYVATAVGAAAVAGYLAFSITNAYDQNTIKDLKLADAAYLQKQTALVADVQKKQDAVSTAAAVAEANSQVRLTTAHDTVTKEIPTYVKDTSTCITFGLVRVLHAAAAGTDPAADTYTSGKPDDACAPVAWRSLAGDIADDYSNALKNAEQLTALQQWETDTTAAQTTP